MVAVMPGMPLTATACGNDDFMAAIFQETFRKIKPSLGFFRKMVGAVRFELTTSCTRNKRASQATLRPDKGGELADCAGQKQSRFSKLPFTSGRIALGCCQAIHEYDYAYRFLSSRCLGRGSDHRMRRSGE